MSNAKAKLLKFEKMMANCGATICCHLPCAKSPQNGSCPHRLIHGGTTADALAVVVRHVRPPVGLHLDVAQNHVLDGGRQARHLRNGGRRACYVT